MVYIGQGQEEKENTKTVGQSFPAHKLILEILPHIALTV